ncbi:MAG: ABC-type multidrug transport system, ATPase component [halophilic archaeon J07HX5]|nr:MAG: ABC-type multidrug transport system, ATPase component [halophilic archaeon J07HX5]
MGVLPEGYDVYDRLTGRQHIEFAIESKDTADDPMALLDRVGLAGDADRQAGGYSKGMAQRLVLAMALAGDPDLLVLDEPTSGLDPNGARRMREIIQAENERGATVFFSSHILEQVEAVCDRVGILTDGSLVAVDTIDGLRESAGGGTVLQITVAEPAEALRGAVAGVDGVDTVRLEDDELVVTCTDTSKMDVLFALDEAGADVVDFTTDEASLEELFAEYTNGGD